MAKYLVWTAAGSCFQRQKSVISTFKCSQQKKKFCQIEIQKPSRLIFLQSFHHFLYNFLWFCFYLFTQTNFLSGNNTLDLVSLYVHERLHWLCRSALHGTVQGKSFIAWPFQFRVHREVRIRAGSFDLFVLVDAFDVRRCDALPLVTGTRQNQNAAIWTNHKSVWSPRSKADALLVSLIVCVWSAVQFSLRFSLVVIVIWLSWLFTATIQSCVWVGLMLRMFSCFEWGGRRESSQRFRTRVRRRTGPGWGRWPLHLEPYRLGDRVQRIHTQG